MQVALIDLWSDDSLVALLVIHFHALHRAVGVERRKIAHDAVEDIDCSLLIFRRDFYENVLRLRRHFAQVPVYDRRQRQNLRVRILNHGVHGGVPNDVKVRLQVLIILDIDVVFTSSFSKS